MKATGIVRRIDDLGRVVIPKVIREKLHLREGDPLELYTEDNAVIFRPYILYIEPWTEIEDIANIVEDSSDFHKYAAELREIAKRMRKDDTR